MSLALNLLSKRQCSFHFSTQPSNQQCLMSRCFILPTPRLWQNALGTSASTCKTIGKRPIPQNSRLYCASLASFSNSPVLIISLSTLLSACCPVVLLWLCNQQPPTIKNPPNADVPSMSSLAQSPSRYASMLSAFPDLGMEVAKSLVPLMYLTVFTNFRHEFWFRILKSLHIHLAVACKSGLRLVM